jgi:hypothetical protein
VIIDAGVKGSCVTATFQIGQSTAFTRNWDLKVILKKQQNVQMG